MVNDKNWTKLRNHIESLSKINKNVVMRYIYNDPDYCNDHNRPTVAMLKKAECETTACIAGHACSLMPKKEFELAVVRGYSSAATEWLGLTEEQSDKLFFEWYDWEDITGEPFDLTTDTYTPEQVLIVLDHYYPIFKSEE